MAIGIVSDEEFDRELERIVPTPTIAEIVDKAKRGRKENDVNVPDVLRNIIGESHITDGRQSAIALAASLGISKQSVDSYKNGTNSLADYDNPTKKNPSLTKHLDKVRTSIQKRASSKLSQVIENITADKMAEASLRTLTGAARDLAGVVKDMAPPNENNGNEEGMNVPKFVLYAPQFVQENRFETIVLDE